MPPLVIFGSALAALVPLAVVAAVFVPMLLGHFRTQNILAHGTPAQARIIALTPTNELYNYQPVAVLTLDVMPDGAPSYQASVRQVITPINANYFAVGNMIPVKFDPAHPDRIAIVSGP
ncbi:MAG TPA: DUF3592 domain-containing protein [Acidocella sp.]|nr:DUF3592 domain-containing protein [Acidocella sp.]